MIHKVALAPQDKYPQARAVYKSDKSMDERFGQLLDLIDMKISPADVKNVFAGADLLIEAFDRAGRLDPLLAGKAS